MKVKTLLMRSGLLLVVAGLTWACCGSCDEFEKNKALVEQFFEAYNAKQDFAGLDEFIAADYVRHSDATEVTEMRGIEEFARFLEEDRATFPDARMTVEQLVAEGDRVAFVARWVASQEGPMGPFPATGKRVELDIAGVHRIENGKIVETWVTWDNLVALKQLGHFPPPSLEKPEEGP